MKKLSTILILFYLVFFSGNVMAWGSPFKSTVPVEGGYGTITEKKTGNSWTGTFERNGRWAKNVTYRHGDGSIVVKGDFILDASSGLLIPESYKAILYDKDRNIEFEGRFKNFPDGWDFNGGKVKYKGKVFEINTPRYWAAGQKVIDLYNREEFQKKETAKKEKEKKSQPKNKYNEKDVMPAASGSGFIINNSGRVVTNFHVIEGCDNVFVFKEGRRYDAKIISQDKFNDLSVLNTNIKSKNYFSISSRNGYLLEDIIVAGFPLGKQVSSSIKTFNGSVSSLAGAGDNYSNFQIDADLNQGNSGGPIINYEGNVIGVAVAKLVETGVEGFNFGIKSSVLRDFLDANNISYKNGSDKTLSKKALSAQIVSSTVYIECWMTYAKLKNLIKQKNSQKAFFKLN